MFCLRSVGCFLSLQILHTFASSLSKRDIRKDLQKIAQSSVFFVALLVNFSSDSLGFPFFNLCYSIVIIFGAVFPLPKSV